MPEEETVYVNGTLRAKDLILSETASFYERFDKNFNGAQLFKKVYKACSTVYAIIGNYGYSGSGSFISLSEQDRQFGYFMTAAHVVVTVESNKRLVASTVIITHPVTNDYIEVSIDKIFIDGVADVAVIKTNIDLSGADFDDCILHLSNVEPSIGDMCIVVGDPGGADVDSFSLGYVRDNHFTSEDQCVDSIFISAPGIGGNSGSPILNKDGDIIGIFTFGFSSFETLCGGANWNTLSIVLPKLLTDTNNLDKKYLGLNYSNPTAFDLKNFYRSKNFPSKGLLVREVSKESPFYGILQRNDLLLSATNGIDTWNFGTSVGQYTFGILLYSTTDKITLSYRRSSIEKTVDVILSKTYKDVPIVLDLYLNGLL